MRISYTNLIDSILASAITASTTDVGYDVTNVQDQRLTVQWVSDSTTSQNVVIDLNPITTATSSINTLAIMGHNIVTGTVLTVEANASNSWGAPSFSTSLTVVEGGVILKFLSSTQLYRYWRFVFSGQASIAVGRLWLGTYITIDPSSLLDFKVNKKRSDTVTHGKNRQKWATAGVGWREFELDFPPMVESMITVINTFYDTVGNHSSFIFCNFDTIRNYVLVEPCYVSLSDNISFKHTEQMKFGFSLKMAEEK